MENERENIVCRLCLKSCECAFEYMVDFTVEMLGFIGLELVLNTNGKPAICKSCSENVQKCFDFKTNCIYTEGYVNSFRNNANMVPLDLMEIYLRKTENENGVMPKDHSVCRLCMKLTESGYCVVLNDETKDAASAKITLGRFFLEINLDISKNPVICMSCNASLYNYLSFAENCVLLEDKNIHYRTEECNSESQKGSILKNYSGNEIYNGIKLKTENLTEKDSQEVYIKQEANEIDEFEDIGVENLSGTPQCRMSNMLCCKNTYTDTNIFEVGLGIEQNCDAVIKPENDAEIHGFDIKNEEIEIKAEDGGTARFQDDMLITNEPSGIAVHQCETDKFETNHEPKHKNHPTLRKDSPKKVVHQCEKCDYKTNHKNNLNSHMLNHRNESEKTLYQCNLCIYAAKYKSVLQRHMLIHKNVSEVKMYSCNVCTHKLKRKGDLKRHMLTHENVSEITMYSCDICTFKTKRKFALRRHMLIHRNGSEIATYSCATCTYSTNLKYYLKRHMLVHKRPSEITMYQCDLCTYKSKVKSRLKRHVLIHENASQVTMFKCELCTYNSKEERDLKRHMLTHKTTGDVSVHSCVICTYKSRQKGQLNRHMLIHKNASEIKMYQCESCTYKSKEKNKLKRHMLKHKSFSEVTTYPCGICNYKAKQKSNLKQHMLFHKSISEITMYQCNLCTYKSRIKCWVKRHMLTHENYSEIVRRPSASKTKRRSSATYVESHPSR